MFSTAASCIVAVSINHHESSLLLTALRYALEQRIMELESGRLEHHVRVEDHASLADERDSLARRLREADDETNRLRKLLDAERQQARAPFLSLLLAKT